MLEEKSKSKVKVIDITTAIPPNVSLESDGNSESLLPGQAPGQKNEEEQAKIFEQAEGIEDHLTGPIDWEHPKAAHVKILDAKAGVVERKRSKVCIVGYAENSRHLAWYDDPDCEIWGVNQLYRFIPRADRWFQVHSNWNDKDRWAPDTDQAEWLRNSPIPVYMTDINPDIPNSVRFPVESIMENLSVHNYFTSSIAFMVALAIADGFKEIGIYGIDLIIGREYHFEKACVEFYLGIAHARGIDYHLPEGCALLWQSHRYGYELEPDYGFFSTDKLLSRKVQLHKQVQELRDDLYKWQGRLDEVIWIRKKSSKPLHTKLDERIGQLRSEVDNRLNKYYLHDGACQEVTRMNDILLTKSRGGQVE